MVPSCGFRRGAGRRLGIGESTATAWAGRWRQTARVEANSQKGCSRSPLKPHSDWLLALIGECADLTLAIRAKETLSNADMAGGLKGLPRAHPWSPAHEIVGCLFLLTIPHPGAQTVSYFTLRVFYSPAVI